MPSKTSRSKSQALKKSAFTCEACRKRKVRCDGATPSCSRCSSRADHCHYALAPTLSYTKTLEQRIATLNAALASSRSSKENAPFEAGKICDAGYPISISASPSSSGRDLPDVNPDPDLSLQFEGLKLKEDGGITFHGPTSFFQLPDSHDVEASSLNKTMSNLDGKERLMNSAWRERAYERLANISEPFKSLLDLHWCWIQPLFNFVYRPAFTRDMMSDGPYYSSILMNAMMSHSIRWVRADPKMVPLLQSYDGGRIFFERSVSELFQDIRQGSAKITTIQTLLLLSAQECGRANRTQAWLYAGMAIRLVEDMGLGIDSRKFGGQIQLSDEETEIRNRLYWSCFLWENILCLYLGRTPILQISSVSPPQVLLDDTAELEIWTPHGVDQSQSTKYPRMQAYSISCFVRMCSLAQILNSILIELYNPQRPRLDQRMQTWIDDQARKLQSWWDDLPDFLRLSANDLPEVCPPNHIAVLNCLYHTIKVLLHRPMLYPKAWVGDDLHSARQGHAVQCTLSASSIVAIYDLFCRSFGAQYTITSLAYSVYTAASIFLLEVQATKASVSASSDRLAFCIQALEQIAVFSPIVGISLRLIYTELERHQIEFFPQGNAVSHGTKTARSTHFQEFTTSTDELWNLLGNEDDEGTEIPDIPQLLDIRSDWWLNLDPNDDDVEVPPELSKASYYAEPPSFSARPGPFFVKGGIVMPHQGSTHNTESSQYLRLL